jgi:hypothetical protein
MARKSAASVVAMCFVVLAGLTSCQKSKPAVTVPPATTVIPGAAVVATTPPTTYAPLTTRPPVVTTGLPPTSAPTAATPATVTNATSPPANGPPPGATALCRDGTYSYAANHQGSCSHHGGVAQFYS